MQKALALPSSFACSSRPCAAVESILTSARSGWAAPDASPGGTARVREGTHLKVWGKEPQNTPALSCQRSPLWRRAGCTAPSHAENTPPRPPPEPPSHLRRQRGAPFRGAGGRKAGSGALGAGPAVGRPPGAAGGTTAGREPFRPDGQQPWAGTTGLLEQPE